MLSISKNLMIFPSLIFLFCAVQVSAFQVSMTQLYFWFEDKVHDSWILDTFEDSHLVTCLQKCRDNTNCSALALGPLRESEVDFVRSCYTLSEITEADCEENDSCEKKGFQVFHLSKPMQPTAKPENLTTTTEVSTDTSSTTAAASSTKVGISTTVDISTTTTKIPYAITQVSSKTNEPSTSTIDSLTTTIERHTTTTESTTFTTEAINTNSESTSTTTNEPTASKTSTATSESSTTSTDSPSTATESSSAIAESTTTAKEITSTTTEVGTSTTTEVGTSSTTEVGTSTTTEVGTSTTGASTTTTDAPDCSNSDSPECQIDNRRNSKCSGTEASIICREPRDQLQVFGLVSTAPLFSDARMQVRCKNEFSQSIFNMKTRKDTYNPFDGTMGCKPDHTITGIDVCFQGELKYVSVECNPLEPGFTIEDKTDMAGNSKQDPAQANCPEEKSMISLRLNKDSNGEINVRIGCSKVIRK